MAILSSSAFPNAPAPMLPLSFAAAATAKRKYDPFYDFIPKQLAQKFSMNFFTVYSDFVAYYEATSGIANPGISADASLADYHRAVDELGRDWQSRIPSWAEVDSQSWTDEQRVSTGQGSFISGTYNELGRAHFGNHGEYGYVAVHALNRLFALGVENTEAIRVIEAVAARHINPNGTIGQTRGLVSLNDWFITLGIPIVGGSDVQVDNLVVARYIIGRHHPSEYFDYFHENVLADMLRIFGQGFWSWHYLVNISNQELSQWRTTHQAWDIGWRNLLDRTQGLTEDNAKDIAAVLIRRGLLWPAQIPFTPLDDISLLLINAGVWGPLYPNPAHGDWNEPVESPVVAWWMVRPTGNPITLGQVERLYELFKISSIPAYWLTTVNYDAVEYYRLLSMAYTNASQDLYARTDRSRVLTPQHAVEIVRELFHAGADIFGLIAKRIHEIDILVSNAGIAAILIPNTADRGSTDWNTPIPSFVTVARAVLAFTGKPVTAHDVSALLSALGAPSPTYAQIFAVTSMSGEAFGGLYGDWPDFPNVNIDPLDRPLVQAAIDAFKARLLRAAAQANELESVATTVWWDIIYVGPGGWPAAANQYGGTDGRGGLLGELDYAISTLEVLQALHPGWTDLHIYREGFIAIEQTLVAQWQIFSARARGIPPVI